jgi:hypothetical protein
MLKLPRWFEDRGGALLSASIGGVVPGLIERRWCRSRKRSKRFDELTPAQRR